jgi:hypothetical protein
VTNEPQKNKESRSAATDLERHAVPNSNPLQSVRVIPVQAGLRPSLAADQIKVEVRKNSQQQTQI